MTFDEVLEQVRELLQSKGRVAYRALKRRFDLDDEYLEDLKAELIGSRHIASSPRSRGAKEILNETSIADRRRYLRTRCNVDSIRFGDAPRHGRHAGWRCR